MPGWRPGRPWTLSGGYGSPRREAIENIVPAVRVGDDAHIRTLLAALAAVADTAALLYLRERLYAPE